MTNTGLHMTNHISFNDYFGLITEDVNAAIETYLGEIKQTPQALQEAMLYSLRAGGKRLRPVMIILAYQACGGTQNIAMPAAVAMEMIHTYSLIHDDLPAMDDDDIRRGRPTSHKVFGEAMAILAGDALLTHAFDIIATYTIDSQIARELVIELSHAAGAAGMIGGQVGDMTHENSTGTLEIVNYIHTHKTAKMFQGAMRMGAICAKADPGTIEQLGIFGLKLGLAFQIVDDLLDITSTEEEMGKQTQKDAQAGKITYPSVVGIEKSQQEVQKLMNEAFDAVVSLNKDAENLRSLADMLVNRKK